MQSWVVIGIQALSCLSVPRSFGHSIHNVYMEKFHPQKCGGKCERTFLNASKLFSVS
jgi:hypothetical protein